MRLIDADALHVEEWMESMGNGMYKVVEVAYKSDIENAPAIEAEPVKHGRWERHYSRPGVYADLFWHCSVCGYKNDDSFAHRYHHYCPHCGAKMDEVDDETD